MLRIKLRYQKLILLCIFLASIYIIIFLWYSRDPYREYISNSYEDQVCHMPKLDIDNPLIMKYLERKSPLKCDDEEDWVEVDGSSVYIKEHIKKKYGRIKCDFTDVIRSSDFGTYDGHSTKTYSGLDLEDSDFVKAYCVATNGKIWEGRLAGIRSNVEIMERIGWEYTPKNSLGMNVLMFGFDSLSRMTFMRMLPKSYQKLKSLGAIVLEGYNIMGDGTPQAIIPLLTGKTELEMPDTRKRMGDMAQYVNIYPFIWNDFRKFGYATAFMEDTPDIGIFTYRLKGFNTQPTDHYMRTWYVDASPHFKDQKSYCMGSIPRHKVMMNYARHMFTVYPKKPKFIFGFHGELSHDSFSLISTADDDVVEWLEWFEENGHLNNTVLIMMSDHGHRFAEMRSTQQGKLEERLPFFSFTFPQWFKTKYAKAYENFEANVYRLTTPLDVHETIKSILHFDGDGIGTLENRSMSLFKKVPRQRSCRDANIDDHWCACLIWQNIDIHTQVVQSAATEFVKFLNNYNNEYTDMCEELKIKDIHDAARLMPNKRLMSFKESKDVDGQIPNLTNDMIKVSSEVLQIKVTTTPGNGLFEFSVIYDLVYKRFIFQIADISRANMYGDDSACIKDTQEQLRKYCFCKH